MSLAVATGVPAREWITEGVEVMQTAHHILAEQEKASSGRGRGRGQTSG